jgi:HEAT repeat protein
MVMDLNRPDVEKMIEEKNVEGLINVLQNDPDSNVRKKAATALGEIGDKKAIGPLIHALYDDNEEVKIQAATALGAIGDRSTVEPLLHARYAAVGSVRQSIVAAIDRLGGEGYMRVSNDPFGRAIKNVLEYLQRTHADSSFGYPQLPPLDAEYLADIKRKLAMDRAAGALVLSSDEQMANSAILNQLENAGLIETVGYMEFKLTLRGRSIDQIDVG